LHRKLLYLACDNRESPSRITGPRGFYGSVQGKQVCLLGNFVFASSISEIFAMQGICFESRRCDYMDLLTIFKILEKPSGVVGKVSRPMVAHFHAFPILL